MKFGNFISTITAILATSAQAAPTAAKGKSTVDIPQDKVLRSLGSMVECEALIPKYEWDYFPAAILCLSNGNGAVMIIIKPTWG